MARYLQYCSSGIAAAAWLPQRHDHLGWHPSRLCAWLHKYPFSADRSSPVYGGVHGVSTVVLTLVRVVLGIKKQSELPHMLLRTEKRLSHAHLYHYCEGARSIITQQILTSISMLQASQGALTSRRGAHFLPGFFDADAAPISPYDSIAHGDEPHYAPYFI